MSQPAAFLASLGQSLAAVGLYDEGHPARERALERSFEQLLALTAQRPSVEFSFPSGETVFGDTVVAELGTWDWAARLSAVGAERIEVDADVTQDSYAAFVEELGARLNGKRTDTSEARQLVRPPIRCGRLRVRKEAVQSSGSALEHAGGSEGPSSLEEEAAAIDWIHGEVERAAPVPMAEVEAVVRSLSLAMRAERRVLLPLLQLKAFDQYTTTHACNVAVLAMALSERLGMSAQEVRSFGVAGLLHDIGKVRIPREILVKPGRFSREELALVRRHPVDGARLILEREHGLGLAAVVAYEHHIFLNGRGYPTLRYLRPCHYASRVVHVCDVYDALCTDRPYRQAWEPEQAIAYIEERAGDELDPVVSRAFVDLVQGALIKRLPVAGTTSAGCENGNESLL